MQKRRAYIFIGPQGSGKGTVIKNISELLSQNYLALEASKCLKTKAEQDASFDQKHGGVIEKMNSGILISNEALFEVFQNQIPDMKNYRILLIDGFVRTPAQAQRIVEILCINGFDIEAVKLQCTKQICMERIIGRKIEEKRLDDSLGEVVDQRLSTYFRNLPGIMEVLYRMSIPVHQIDASSKPYLVLENLRNKVHTIAVNLAY